MESAASTLTRSVSLSARLRHTRTARFPSPQLSPRVAASPRALPLQRYRSDAALASARSAAVLLRHSPIPEADDHEEKASLVHSGGNGGGDGGRGGDGGDGSGSGCNMGEYYRRALRVDPENPLLLRNYGKYLHEVEGDLAGAEGCYARALLACPDDADLLSLYGRVIWEARQEKDRAVAYFERAVQAAPDDCYVLGSYASFLWDAEEAAATEADLQKEETASTTAVPSSSCGAPSLVPAC
uniref:Uncharacterized protein n=1 Tax=Arundo donax TaxID=35708 RepID=A0A0A9G206_ARUDO